jgi:uncharacterized membrane protein
MSPKKQNIFVSTSQSIWTLFLSGLFALLPITLTVGVFTLTLRLIQGWLQPLKHIGFLPSTPYSEFLLAILIILVAGTLYNMFILRPFIHALENLFFKLPLIRPVYSGIKKLVDAFSFQDKASFSKVVMVQFPRPNIYSIGFLANECDGSLNTPTDKKYFSIFIPTTPNPTSGFLVIVPEDEITILDISRQEAMAMIISGGIIQPDSVKKE